jgi:hypothetical protein
MIERKEFIFRRFQRFAGVGLQGAIQSDGRSGPRHIQTIELGFIKWVGQLDEHRIDFLSRLNGCLRWGRR